MMAWLAQIMTLAPERGIAAEPPGALPTGRPQEIAPGGKEGGHLSKRKIPMRPR
jgi:hypothetical protein